MRGMADATELAGHLEQACGIQVSRLSPLDKGVVRVDRPDGPAERCTGDVSTMDGHSVLVTEFVEGERAKGRARTYAILGALLGRNPMSYEGCPARWGYWR